jgi:fatty-acyl-CoA synthase
MSTNNLSIIHGIDLKDEEGLGPLTMNGWLKSVCDEYPSNDALVFHDDGQRIVWTYATLWEKANEVSKSLIKLGISKGTRVGVMMTNRPEFLTAVWGTTLAGGIATTISTFSTKDELEYLLAQSSCQILLMERNVVNKDFALAVAEILPELSVLSEPLMTSKLPFLRHVITIGAPLPGMMAWHDFIDYGKSVSQALVDAMAASVTPADPGAIFFSSGSTSKPKGIINAHRGVSLQLWRWKRFYQTASDARTWSANGFFWSGNFGMAIGGTLTAGGCLVLQKTFLPEEALAIMSKEKATMAIAWPHQWPQLEAAKNWLEADLSSMKYVSNLSGLAKHPTVNVDWHEPINAYGNTETFTISSIFASGTPSEVIANSSGEPVPGMTFKIVDPLSGETLPLGQEGEIAVKGPTLMLGYIGIPLDQSVDENGFLRTGDGGYVDQENRLYWKGRLNDIIKTGGANVSPAEIDSVIQHAPGVKLSQTVGIPHDTLGEIVVSCIVLHEGQSSDQTSIQAFAKQKLASYKVPRIVMFFDEADFKTTGSAKIKTADLKAIVAKRLDS